MAKRRAVEAEAGRREIKRLYEELQDAFELASQAEAFKRASLNRASRRSNSRLANALTSIMASATLLLEDRENGAQAGANPLNKRPLRVITQAGNRADRFVGVWLIWLYRSWRHEPASELGRVDEIIEVALTR